MLSALVALEDELAALANGTTGNLRLAACDGFGTYVLPAIVGAFAAERPDAQIQAGILPSAEVVRAVARGDAQLGIAGETPRHDGIVAERLLREQLIWIASGPNGDGSADAKGAPPDLERLTLVAQGAQSGTRARTDALLRTHGWTAVRTLELASLEAVKRAVAYGTGIALVSSLAVASELASGTLREMQVDGQPPVYRWIQLVRAKDHDRSPLETLFEQALRHHCGPVAATRPAVAA